jgi:hypothetical protein
MQILSEHRICKCGLCFSRLTSIHKQSKHYSKYIEGDEQITTFKQIQHQPNVTNVTIQSCKSNKFISTFLLLKLQDIIN